jgi:hypothetical protein
LYLSILKLTGLLGALWMFVGVILVARKFPGYSHKGQVMSELGARGRPSASIHPLVNNYPIGVLFIVFGIYILSSYWADLPMAAIGLLVVIHGLSHLVTGLYPCDADLGIPKASSTQIIHNIAGLMMLVSLLVASIVGAVSSLVEVSQWFQVFSLTCALVSVIFTILMGQSLSTGRNIGLYQRISCGALMVWVAVFSGVVYINA